MPGPSWRAGPALFAPSQITLKTVFTLCAGVALFLAAVWAVWHVPVAISLVLASAVLAAALDRGVRWLVAKGVPRGLAIAGVMLGMVAFFVVPAWMILPKAVEQARRLIEESPAIIDSLRGSALYRQIDGWTDLDVVVDRALADVRRQPEVVAGWAIRVATWALKGLAGVVSLLFIVLFMLVYGPGLVSWTLAQTLPGHRRRYVNAAGRAYLAIGGYLAGLAAVVVANILVTTVFLAAIGVPYFLPLGVLSGMSSLVPFIGALAAGVVISVVAAATQGLWYGVAAVIYYVVYQQFENHLLGPYVYKRTVQLNPLLVILVVLALGELAGIVGAVLAVPLLAVARVVVAELLSLRAEQLDLPEPPDTQPEQPP